MLAASQPASLPVSLPAVRLGCTRCRAPEISYNKGDGSGFTKMLFQKRFTHYSMRIPFILRLACIKSKETRII